MIITKKVSIRINNKNIKHFYKIGYENIRINEYINVPIDHLMRGSKTGILVSCDVCFSEKVISYKLYNYCISKHNIYTCNGICSNIKREKTNIKLFGSKSWMQIPENYQKYKEIIFKKTGYDNIFKSPISQEKFRNTIRKRYGVSELSHSEEIYKNQQISGFSMKKHKETGLYYRGTYELNFLDYCFSKNIDISQGKRFSYIINNKNHYYFSDFLLSSKNLIIEIKSSYYWKKYLDINIAKMDSVKNNGYGYLLILNKNYDEFEKIILAH